MRVVDQAALTHVGLRRELNEDNHAALPELGMGGVADGMGGHEGGEIASEIARDQLIEGARLGRSLVETIEEAHEEIMSHPLAGGDRGMGTTVVALRARLDGDRVEIAWVGDSRAYVLDETGLTQRSRDHTLVQKMVDSGVLAMADVSAHPERNVILQALGIDHSASPLNIETWSTHLTGPARVLLCSDGLTEHVSDPTLAELLSRSSCQEAAQALVDAALAGGGSDNITVIVVDLAPGCD